MKNHTVEEGIINNRQAAYIWNIESMPNYR